MKPLYTDYLPTLDYDKDASFVYNRGLGTFGDTTDLCRDFIASVTLRYNDGSETPASITDKSFSFAKMTDLSKYPVSLVLSLQTQSSTSALEFSLGSLPENYYTLQWEFNVCSGFSKLILTSEDGAGLPITWETCHSAIAVGSDITADGTGEVVKYNSATSKAYYQTTAGVTSEIDLLSDGVSQIYVNEQAVRYTDLNV